MITGDNKVNKSSCPSNRKKFSFQVHLKTLNESLKSKKARIINLLTSETAFLFLNFVLVDIMFKLGNYSELKGD